MKTVLSILFLSVMLGTAGAESCTDIMLHPEKIGCKTFVACVWDKPLGPATPICMPGGIVPTDLLPPCERYRIEYHTQTTFAAQGRVILFRIAVHDGANKWIEAYKNIEGRYWTTLKSARWWLKRYKAGDGCKVGCERSEFPPKRVITKDTENMFASIVKRPDIFRWIPWTEDSYERIKREHKLDLDYRPDDGWMTKRCR